MWNDEFNSLTRCFVLREFLDYLAEKAKIGLFSLTETAGQTCSGLIYDDKHGIENAEAHCMQYPILLKECEVVDRAFKRNEFRVFVNIYKNDTAVILLEVYNPDSIYHPLSFSISNVDGWHLDD